MKFIILEGFCLLMARKAFLVTSVGVIETNALRHSLAEAGCRLQWLITSAYVGVFSDSDLPDAVPELRSMQATRVFNVDLARVDYKLEAWR